MSHENDRYMDEIASLQKSRTELIAKRNGSRIGRLMLRLGMNGRSYQNRSDKIFIQYLAGSYTSAAEKRLSLFLGQEEKKFVEMPLLAQCRVAERAGWLAVHARPNGSDKRKMNNQKNAINPIGPNLDITYTTSLMFPSMGMTEPQDFCFAGEHIAERVPNENTWMMNRGKRAKRELYLTTACGEAANPVTIALHDSGLNYLTQDERWSIFSAGHILSARMDDINTIARSKRRNPFV